MSAIHISGVDAVVTLSTSAPFSSETPVPPAAGSVDGSQMNPSKELTLGQREVTSLSLGSPHPLTSPLGYLEGGAKPDPLALIQDISDGLSSSRACCGAS